VTKRVIQQSRIRIPGQTTVHNSVTGRVILCAWDTCDKAGYDEIKILVKEPGKTLHYIFCSERHKRYHIHGHREFGKLAP
jgi:hypothetical protein